jgi:LacI family transcriptional regulator, sucrose operon repressor
MKKKISLQDIAKLAGVSKTTVSAVLNDRSEEYGIRAETQQKVKDLAERFQYKPNKMARGLRLKKTQTIGLVVPDLSNWFFSQLSGAFQNVVSGAGYHLYITSSNNNEEEEYRVINDLLAWHIDGLIVASMMKKEQIPQNFLHSQIPIIYIDRRIEGDNISWVASDNERGAYELVSYLCSTGVQEIYYLGGLETISTFINRLKGYRQALEDHGLRFDPTIVFERGFTAADSYCSVQAMVRQRHGFPEAIFAASCDFIAGLLHFIRDQIGEIPATLKIGTYDDHALLDFLSVKIPSVQQDTDRMAAAAFEMLEQSMNGEREMQHQIIPPRLIIRE